LPLKSWIGFETTCAKIQTQNMGFVRELWAFLRIRKKFWLLPIILMTLVFGVLLLLAQSSAIAPFIYTLF
jgi:hypothetical protein